MKKLPRDRTDAICSKCSTLRREGHTDKQIAIAHAICHGWVHCFSSQPETACCGPCMVCGG
jgi:hypothetical protein